MLKKIASYTAAAVIMSAALTSCGSTVQLGNTSDAPTSAAVTATAEENRAANQVEAVEKVITQAPAEEPVTEPFHLDVSVPDNFQIPASFMIDGFQTVLQNPELPTGCEVTSLTQTLNYLGFNIDKLTLADNFMPMDFHALVVMDEAYVGDPKLDGFGCNANIIVQTADKYFASIDSPCYGEEITGSTLDQLLWQVTQGRPVITWVTIDLRETTPEFVWTAANGKDLVFNWYQHCLTVYGYDKEKGVVYVADPLEGNITYPLDKFERIYDLMGNQAVLICGNSETKGKFVVREREKSPILSRNAAQRKADEEDAARRMAEEEARRKAEEEAKRIAEAESVAEPAPDEQVPEEAEQSPQPDEEEISAEEEQE